MAIQGKIEFRVWTNGRMVYQDHALSKMSRFWRIVEYDKKAIVMQFTGLYDKNKKKIFEGDIVEYENVNAGYGRPHEEEVNTEEVVFKGGAFYPVCEMPVEEFKVIGNIYEDPK